MAPKPKYFARAVREASFTNLRLPGTRGRATKKNTASWPHESPSIEDMAAAGFYYDPIPGIDDRVTCFMCLSSLDGWEPADVPVQEHYTHVPECSWATICSKQWEQEKFQDLPASIHGPHSELAVNARMDTFVHWPHSKKNKDPKSKLSSNSMANAGFYYTPETPGDDTASCAYCTVTLDGWEPTDDPAEEHRRRNDRCVFFAVDTLKTEDSGPLGAASVSPAARNKKRSSAAVTEKVRPKRKEAKKLRLSSLSDDEEEERRLTAILKQERISEVPMAENEPLAPPIDESEADQGLESENELASGPEEMPKGPEDHEKHGDEPADDAPVHDKPVRGQLDVEPDVSRSTADYDDSDEEPEVPGEGQGEGEQLPGESDQVSTEIADPQAGGEDAESAVDAKDSDDDVFEDATRGEIQSLADEKTDDGDARAGVDATDAKDAINDGDMASTETAVHNTAAGADDAEIDVNDVDEGDDGDALIPRGPRKSRISAAKSNQPQSARESKASGPAPPPAEAEPVAEDTAPGPEPELSDAEPEDPPLDVKKRPQRAKKSQRSSSQSSDRLSDVSQRIMSIPGAFPSPVRSSSKRKSESTPELPPKSAKFSAVEEPQKAFSLTPSKPSQPEPTPSPVPSDPTTPQQEAATHPMAEFDPDMVFSLLDEIPGFSIPSDKMMEMTVVEWYKSLADQSEALSRKKCDDLVAILQDQGDKAIKVIQQLPTRERTVF